MDIIMIRHGETDDNVSKIFSRDTTKLTNNGKKQILKTRENIKELSYDKIYFSPLTRTVETLDVLGLEGKSEERIREIDFGIFTGKTFKEIKEIYPKETEAWLDDTNNYLIPEGESLLNVYKRVKEFLEEALAKNENILLVTHDCVIRLALCWVFDNPDYFFKFKVDNGSINTISIDDGFKFIRKLNY